MEVLNSLKLNTKHRCWLLTLNFFLMATPHPEALPAVTVQQSVTDAPFSPSTPHLPAHTALSALFFRSFNTVLASVWAFHLRLMNRVFRLIRINIFVQHKTSFENGSWSTNLNDPYSIYIFFKFWFRSVFIDNQQKLCDYSLLYNIKKNNLACIHLQQNQW